MTTEMKKKEENKTNENPVNSQEQILDEAQNIENQDLTQNNTLNNNGQ
jgi:hypothetical protein